jgi:predicted O-linked N-acetylglucosamine transferase (SPINDLY family)
LNNLLTSAIKLADDGQSQKAKEILLISLKSEKNNPVIYYYLAKVESDLGNQEDALQYINKALQLKSNFSELHLAKSIINLKLGNVSDAQSSALNASKLNESNYPSSNQVNTELIKLNETALQLQNSGHYKESEDFLNKSLQIDPNNFVALYSLGISKIRQENTGFALKYFDKLVSLYPNNATGIYGRAKCLQDLGLFEEALKQYDRSIALDKNLAGAYHNKAVILQLLNRHKEALLTLISAFEQDPSDTQALEGQGILLTQFKEYLQAANVFQNLLSLSPDAPFVAGQLISAKLHNCDWSNFDKITGDIFLGTASNSKVCNPLTFMGISSDANLAKKCAATFGSTKYPKSQISLWNGEIYSHNKKRIGFISGDFREHPVGYLLIGMVEALDRNLFEISGFFTGSKDNSTLQKRFASTFDNFLHCNAKTDFEIAKLINSHEIDIIIDLSGYTADSRLLALSYRPAPIQITYLGYPGTLGLTYIDYILADNITIPDSHKKFYSEKVLSFPHCYLPRDNFEQPSTKSLKRVDFQLPDDGFIFCSFNNNYKITPSIFSVWMKLLQEVNNSYLWLMDLHEATKDNILKTASDYGNFSNRIIFAKRVPKIEDHLARYRLADLFLDTFPYNGHTTCSDALFMGLPVVTLTGETFASRVCLSLLHDLNLDELSTASTEEYFELAKSLANDSKRLSKFKKKLHTSLKNKAWPIDPILHANNLLNIINNL